jgi:hypothetical protein
MEDAVCGMRVAPPIIGVYDEKTVAGLTLHLNAITFRRTGVKSHRSVPGMNCQRLSLQMPRR